MNFLIRICISHVLILTWINSNNLDYIMYIFSVRMLVVRYGKCRDGKIVVHHKPPICTDWDILSSTDSTRLFLILCHCYFMLSHTFFTKWYACALSCVAVKMNSMNTHPYVCTQHFHKANLNFHLVELYLLSEQ